MLDILDDDINNYIKTPVINKQKTAEQKNVTYDEQKTLAQMTNLLNNLKNNKQVTRTNIMRDRLRKKLENKRKLNNKSGNN